MAEFPESSVIFDTSPTWTAALARTEFMKWLDATMQLPGGQEPESLTITSGQITPSSAFCIVDTEESAESDTLSVIVSDNLQSGAIIALRATSSERTVTLEHSTVTNGIILNSGANSILSHQTWVLLQHITGAWHEIEYKNLAINTEYDNSTSSLTSTNIQNAIDETVNRLDDVEVITYASNAATVSWNMETDTWSGNPHANAAHESMRRCVVDNTGTVQYYLDEYDSTLQADGVTPANLDGTDGQVMVEIAPFYVRTAFNGHVATWSVSPEPLPGYVLHPAFDGGVLKSYVGAYDAIVYDTSAGAYIDGLNLDDNTSRVALGEDMLASVATGNFPMVGLTRNEFRILAENAGFQLYDFWQWQAVMMLFVTEYGSWNSQAVLGRGNVDRTYVESSSDQADSPHTAPGLSNVIGNGSGGIDDADGNPWVSYRGIENPWGNCWNFVDGWNIQDRQSYVSNDETSFADDTADGYDAIGGLMPVGSDSAIKNWQFVDNVFLVRTVDDGASTSAFVTDNFWTNTGWRVAFVGGGADHTLKAGLTCCNLSNDSAHRNRSRGARLSKKLRS